MEVKCQCQRSNNIAPISCTCEQSSHSCPSSDIGRRREGDSSSNNSKSNRSSAFYWAQPLPPVALANSNSKNYNSGERRTRTNLTDNLSGCGTSNTNTGSYSLSKGVSKESLVFNKEMAPSWKYPASICIAPCISTRRLNRTYTEQRMRCFLTTTIAFCLGISVGALLPFVFPPVDMINSSLSPNTESIINAKGVFQLSQPQKLLSLPQSENSFDFDNNNNNLSSNQAVISPKAELRNNNGSAPSSVYSPVTFVDNSLNNNNNNNKNNLSVQESGKGLPVVDGIYLSDWVERLLPKGFTDNDVANWRALANNSKVTRVDSGCGRMQNRLITYEDGNKACCRYRQNFDQIQGEIFSFYLSQLLGIKNLAPSTLDVISAKNVKWSGVQNEIQSAQWVDDRPVVLTKFVNNLQPAFIPTLLRSSTRRVHPPDLPPLPVPQSEDGSFPMDSSAKRFFDDISELAQWSDLIIFDYLTANLDRMVNNLYNLQWNPTMMEAPAHNLAKDENGLLVFLDNESGLLHGYRLLDKYEHYHRLMLDSICVFRKSTVEAIERLHSYGSIQPLFKSMLSQFASSQLLPMIPDKSIKVLNQRIDTVYRQIQKCQSLYKSRTSNET